MDDDRKYQNMLEQAMNRTDVSWSEMISGLHGLKRLLIEHELPYADENAQADIEGRPRPVRSYGGISRIKNEWWK